MTAMEIIRTEARAHRTVVVDGLEKDGSREIREVEPYSVRPGKSHNRLMFWCLKRNAMRSLLVSNIRNAEATGRVTRRRRDGHSCHAIPSSSECD